MFILGTIGGYFTVGFLILIGIIGFIIGIGGSGFFISRKDKWANSGADISGKRLNTGCVFAIVFMVIAGWLIVKIFG